MYYGCSTDVLGLLIARIEGAPLGDVLKRRIFDPLGMRDTRFLVPWEKWERRAVAYGFDDDGRLMKHVSRSGVFVAERPERMAYESGGAGLWTTPDDYLSFARWFLGDGAVDGVRLLRAETLAAMMTNHLTDSQRANSVLLGQKPFAVGRGFGFGVSVVLETDKSDFMRCGTRERLVGRASGAGGGRLIRKTVRCSSFWLTIWSTLRRWPKGSAWACGAPSTRFERWQEPVSSG